MDMNIPELAKPWEILDLKDGETVNIGIDEWELGRMRIETKEVPQGKDIQVLRVYVTKISKEAGAPWWDITSQTLIAQLLPHLEAPGYTEKKYTITKHGVAPRARFTLEVSG